jgi:hypothetical protein
MYQGHRTEYSATADEAALRDISEFLGAACRPLNSARSPPGTLRPSWSDAISGLLQNRTTTSQPFLTRCRRRASTTSDARLLNIAPNDDDARQILHWWGLETWDQQMRRLRLQILPACVAVPSKRSNRIPGRNGTLSDSRSLIDA